MAGDPHSHLVADDLNLQIRSQLAAAIGERITRNGWTQAEAAQRLGVQQPRISLLVGGHIDRFSIDALLTLATLCGLQVEVVIKRC